MSAIDHDVYFGATFRLYGALVGKTETDFDVRVGGTICAVNPPATSTGLFPSATSPYAVFTISCVLNSEMAGYYNVTVGSTSGSGVLPSLYYVYPSDPNAVPSMATVRPVITSLTSNAGGNLGGYPITIFGTGFSNAMENNLVRAATLLRSSGGRLC